MLKTVFQLKLFHNSAELSKSATTMKYLNVAEKHDAAKTIAGLLSNGVARRREGYSVYNKVFDFDSSVKGKQCKMVMTSVSGHLLQLEFLVSYRNWRNVDPKSLFDAPIRKACNEDYLPIKRTLEREIKSCNGLIVWTDCDREGENIGFEIIDVCRAIKPNISVHRAIFSEITSTSVRRALNTLQAPDKRQSDAVDVRSELDLRTGAAITRFQTMRLQRLFPEKIADKLISYGSCQIPTLGFVAERYKEVEAFISEPFWKIKVTHTIDELTVDFNWARNRLFDKEACEDFLMLCLADPNAKVESVIVKPKNKWRPSPMDTIEMEKLGSRKLKLTAKETMTIAEKLYTKGIISYPRTETNMFSKEIDLRSLVDQQCAHSIWGPFAQRVIEWGPNPRNGNKSDQAHPPIHPTKLVTNLEGNEARVYELICRHFLACVSKDAVGSETVVHINIAGEKFIATGLCIFERNYLDVYIYDKWNAKLIHKYEQGQVFEPTEISMAEGATTAPPLLTEADLITLMEKNGIGTDATHAEHINTIKERGYIGVVDKGCLVPGVIGMGLYEGYDAMELVLAKPVLRAQFEADLKKICSGEKDPNLVLQEQIVQYKEAYRKIEEKITAMDEKVGLRINETPSQHDESNTTTSNNTNTENNPNRIQELFQCPKCTVASLSLKQKKNKTGFYIDCLNFPDCKNAIWLPEEFKEPTVLDETCEKCGNEAKLLKFKFSSVLYKSMFNAFGSYKTCLRCDSKLRESFNINLDNVKKVGAIVGAGPSIMQRNIPNSFTNSNPAERNTNYSDRSSGQIGARGRPKKPKSISRTTSSSVRNFFSSATLSVDNPDNTNEIPIDELFDSNDGFEDLMIAAEQAVPVTTHADIRTDISEIDHTIDLVAAFSDSVDADFQNFTWGTAGNGNRNIVADSNRNTPLPINNDSFADLFSNDNDFENYSWGSAARNSQNTINSSPAHKRARLATQSSETTENSFSYPSQPSTSVADRPKCSGCHQIAKELNVKKDGPNKGRLFYVCPKTNPCKFFEWAGEVTYQSSSTSTSQSTHSSRSNHIFNLPIDSDTSMSIDSSADNTVKCGCTGNNHAKSLIVRKEGPNKNRPFYTCANSTQSCGFFKWADEDNQASTSTGIRNSSQNWGSGSQDTHCNFSAVTSGRTSNQKEKKTSENTKRKCGLCRQEGHSKPKCPRKSEF